MPRETRVERLAVLLAACSAPCAAEAEGPRAEVAYTGEAWRSASGGLATGGRYLDNLELLLSDELPALPLIGATEAQLHVLYNNEARLTDDLVGDLQGASNIDAPGAVRLFEAWLQRCFDAPCESTLRAGLYDLNSEFDALQAAELFVHSSHGIGPDLARSGGNGPSIFPVTGLAVRFDLPLSERVRARVAALDAVPGDPDSPGSHALRLSSREGALLIAELDAGAVEVVRIFAGAWTYTHSAPTVREELLPGAAAERSRASGGYLAVEGTLSREVRGFARVGLASEAVHVVGRYVGAGITWTAPAFGGVELGLAVAHARASEAYRDALAERGERAGSAETAIEATARFTLPGGFVLQPDVQYILDPGLDPALEDALLMGLRLRWSWSSPPAGRGHTRH